MSASIWNPAGNSLPAYPFINLNQYADLVDSDDWSPAWQAAHDYVASLPAGGTVVFPNGFSEQFKTAITWNPNKVKVDGNGAIIDCSAFSGANYFITLVQTINDANARSAANRTHPWENCVFVGTATATGSVTCIKVADENPISGTYWAAGVTFRDCAFGNWYRDVEIGIGGFFFQAINCAFYITGGSGYDCSINILNATNSGENISFNQCYFGKVSGSVIRCVNPNASVYATNCSADYTANCFDFSGGTLHWNGYIEASNDTDYWVKVSGQNTLVRLSGEVIITGNKSTYELFYVDSSSTNGGLVADISVQWGTFTYTVASGLMIAGTGRALVNLTAHSHTSVHPALGAGTNVLANGGFESTALTDWTLSGTTPPARVAGPARTGTYSLRFPGTSTNTPAASRKIPCRPGQQLVGALWYQTASIAGTSGTFYCIIEYLDAGDTVIQGSAIFSVTTNVGTWTLAQLSQLLPAPIGTVNARVSISLFGTASGAPMGYIDDVTIAVA